MRHKHGDYHDFENSEETVDDFLNNVRSQPKPSGLKRIKRSFLIENIQQSASENLRPILNTRYWTTDVFFQSQRIMMMMKTIIILSLAQYFLL